MSRVYEIIVDELSSMVNKSQYFNPFFSWIIVVYTYFSIGLHGGKIWKYLFYVVTLGYAASCCCVIYTIAEKLNYKYTLFIKLQWIENILWGVNEWGYVYINFIKIRACVNTLKSKIWDIIFYIILIYLLCVRLVIAYLDTTGRIEVYEFNQTSNNKISYDDTFSSKLCSALFFPLGIMCSFFIYHIILQFIKEDNSESRNLLSIILHSTLSRMLIVSLIFLGISIIVFFPSHGVTGFIRRLLWRTKGNLGIIFLVDILLLRIDLDQNKLNDQNHKINNMNLENSIKAKALNIGPPQPSQPTKENYENDLGYDYANSIFSKNTKDSSVVNNYYHDHYKGNIWEFHEDMTPYNFNLEQGDLGRSNNSTINSLGRSQMTNYSMTPISASTKIPGINKSLNDSTSHSYVNLNLRKVSSSSIGGSETTYTSLPKKHPNPMMDDKKYNDISKIHPENIVTESNYHSYF